MIAQILIHMFLGCAVSSTVLYAMGSRGNANALKVARGIFSALALILLASSTILITLILSHDFRYTYVQSYSSADLPTHLLIASFYSGQEGSFLLWTLLVAGIGVVLAPYARRFGYEGAAMSFYSLILVFLGLLLVAKNPFAYVWQTYAADGIQVTFVPEKGRGLNPLLHNAWITIHPPILFTGFASMSVSFVFAMAGLVKREYHRWIDVALPWTLAATGILGFGIMLGGFWAYETLGWGGFWGWDPVENSSLIPWLVSVALVHTMLVQKRTRGLVKTNMVLAVAAFVMVLYSTFLTRSGVLGDTSVHSFVDPGKFAFWILLAFMVTFVAIGVYLVVIRSKDMNIAREDFTPTTREFMLAIGSALIMASAVLVTIGTSWPVLLEIIGQPKVAVATTFYDNVHLILVPLVFVVNGLSLLLQWRSSPLAVIRRRLAVAAVATAACTVVTVVLGVHKPEMIVLAAAAWFSLVINAQHMWSFITKSAAMLGAYVSHLGFALLMFGVIATSGYTVVHHAVLPQGVPTAVGDYTLTFAGKEQVEKQFRDREKFRYAVSIARGSDSTTVFPVLYYSDFNQRQSAFLEPGIRWGMIRDLYISPKATEMEDVYKKTTVQRGASIKMPFDTTITLQLERFSMPTTEEPAPDGRMRMSALVQVESFGVRADSILRVPTRISQTSTGMAFDPEWTAIPGTQWGIGLVKIVRDNENVDQSTADFVFRDMGKPLPTPKETFTVEFSEKPLIGLVWIGVVTMVAGFAFSIARYARQAAQRSTLLVSTESPHSGQQTIKANTANLHPNES